MNWKPILKVDDIPKEDREYFIRFTDWDKKAKWLSRKKLVEVFFYYKIGCLEYLDESEPNSSTGSERSIASKAKSGV